MNNGVEELESIPTKIRYKGIVWIPEKHKNPCEIGGRPSRLYLWLRDNKKPGDIFTLEEYYHSNPTRPSRKNMIEGYRDKMIKEKQIQQLHDDSFKVLCL